MMQDQLLIPPKQHKNRSDSGSDISTDHDDPEHNPEVAHIQTPSTSLKVRSSKAKSSLCKNFTEKGYCPYGNKCQFAHGPQELRINMETNRSYKTKGCHAFAKKGYCCYGSRCNFIHQPENELPDPAEKWKQIFSNHRETFGSVEEGSKLMGLLDLPTIN